MKAEEGMSIISIVVGLLFVCLALIVEHPIDGSRPDIALGVFGLVFFGIGAFYLGRYNSGGRSK